MPVGRGLAVLPSDPASRARWQGLSCGFRGASSRPSTLRGSPPDPLSPASRDPFLISGHFHPPTCPGPALPGQSGAGDPVCPRHDMPLPAWEEHPARTGTAKITFPSLPCSQAGSQPCIPKDAGPGAWVGILGCLLEGEGLRHRPLPSFPTPAVPMSRLQVKQPSSAVR